MSLSDLMTGLMVIFLFVAIAYIMRVEDNQTVLTDYVETKNKLHEKLVDKFKGDTLRWKMSIGKDLTMKFNNPAVLFQSGSDQLTLEFMQILDEFLPRYFGILINDSLKNQIQEIRIEGHTDDVPYPQLDPDKYIANVILSQRRSLSVLRYFRSMKCFEQYSDKDKRLIEFWLTANGLSYGRSVDRFGDYTIKSGVEIDRALSRRVEFRIVTNGDKLLEDFVKKIDKNGR